MTELAPTEQLLLTRAEAAELLRRPVATLAYWAHTGYGPQSVRIGRAALYRRADVERWLDEQFATNSGDAA